MLYSDLFLKRQRKVPVILVSLTLVTIIFAVSFFFNSVKIPTRASSDYPKQIKVTNLTKNKAVIFWESAKKEVGYVLLGESPRNIKRFYLDDRDTPSYQTPRFFHIVTITDLKEESLRYFKIVSNNKVFLNLDNQPFSFKTLAKNSIIYSSKPLYGKIIDNKNIGIDQAVLIFYGKDIPYFLAKTKSTGEWLIVLQRETKSFSEDEIVNIEVYSEDNTGRSFIRAKLKNLSPLKEPIILGKNYNFLNEEEQVLSASDQIANSMNVSYRLTVIYPQENAIIPGNRPLLKGTAFPAKEVNVILSSKEIYSFKTKSDSKGNWLIALNFNLLPGDYQMEVISSNANNQRQIVKRLFKIAKSGETVLGEATPSATIVPTELPTLVPTTVTNIPSPTIYKTGSFNWSVLLTLSAFSIIFGLFIILAF